MTPQEKAAAYDKAIERTRRMIEDYKNRGLENYIACAKENIDYIFPELKESEGESMKESLITFFRKYPYSIRDAGINPLDAIAWLEKQGEQKPVGFNIGDESRVVAIDKPAVWSEEDEKMLVGCVQAMCTPDAYSLNDRINFEYWLKSLKERYTWKPSDEQMKALSNINVTGCISYAEQGQELVNLYNDLKKLRKK